MSFFVDRWNRRKSPIALAAFGAAVLDVLVFGVLYALLAEPLYRTVSLGSAAATNAAHSLIVAIAGTAVCCLLFLLRDKRVAPYGFGGLAVVLAMFYAAALMLEREARSAMLPIISLYGIAPVLVGNAVTWTIYRKLKRKNPALNDRKTLRQELNEAIERETAKEAVRQAKRQAKEPQRPAPPPGAPPAPPAAQETAPSPEEALFGPESGGGPAAFRSAQEEAMLFYEDDEENDD